VPILLFWYIKFSHNTQRPKVKFTFIKVIKPLPILRLDFIRLAAADPTGWAHGAYYYFPFSSSQLMELMINVSIQLIVLGKRK
jgi:hypothetical protein